MATFKVIDVTFNELTPEILSTRIEYVFDDARTVTVDIPHSSPKTVQQMTDNITARGRSEWKRLTDSDTAAAIVQSLQVYVNNTYPFQQTL